MDSIRAEVVVCRSRDTSGVGAPSGTVTFLFTDIEGSTRLWESAPDVMRLALARHDEIVRSSVESRGGWVFTTAGDGFGAAFDRAGRSAQTRLTASNAMMRRRTAEDRTPDALNAARKQCARPRS